MDYNALNLSGKNPNFNPRSNPLNPNVMKQHFDVLSQFGGDINAAVAAAAAVSAAQNQSQNDALAAVANMNALAQLNQFASQNPKMAAMLQLQQQLQGMAQQQQQVTGHHQNLSNNSSSSNVMNHHQGGNINNHHFSTSSKPGHTRYQQLLSLIDEMGKDMRTTYLNNKNSTERLKRSIASARILVKDCQLECERNTKQ